MGQEPVRAHHAQLPCPASQNTLGRVRGGGRKGVKGHCYFAPLVQTLMELSDSLVLAPDLLTGGDIWS